MCNPAVIPAVIAVAGVAAQGVGAMSGADADKQAAEAQAQAARAQQRDALERGAETAGLVREKGSQILGAQRAALAANGVELSSGSARTLLDSTRVGVEEDVAAARASALREAWGFASDVAMAEYNKKLAKRKSTLALLTGGLMAGAQGYAAYQRYKDTGGGGGTNYVQTTAPSLDSMRGYGSMAGNG